MDEETRDFMTQMMRQYMTQINTKLDDILDRLAQNREDIENTRGHVVYVMEDGLTLGKRITKLEDEMRQARRRD